MYIVGSRVLHSLKFDLTLCDLLIKFLNWQIVKLALDAHGRSLLRAYGYNGYIVSAFKQNL
uniref:Uncharacterized protein n=1 Tax=Glossina palpalis gambiensis TaxID=67801 RepID=A0A1B0B576_9MUSC